MTETETLTFAPPTVGDLPAVALSRAERWPHRPGTGRCSSASVAASRRGSAIGWSARRWRYALRPRRHRLHDHRRPSEDARPRARPARHGTGDGAGRAAGNGGSSPPRTGCPAPYEKFSCASGRIVQHQGPVAAVAAPDGSPGRPGRSPALVALDRAATGATARTSSPPLARGRLAARHGHRLCRAALVRPWRRGARHRP